MAFILVMQTKWRILNVFNLIYVSTCVCTMVKVYLFEIFDKFYSIFHDCY